jgi:hypothetical protein
VLTLDTGGFVAFFGKTGLINDPDTMPMCMTPGHVLLEAVSGSSLIPAEQAQKLLQVAWGLTESVGHWLDTLSRQVAQLTLNVEIQIAPRCDSTEAVIKLVQKSGQFRFDSHNRFDVHVDNLLKNNSLQEYHRLAA